MVEAEGGHKWEGPWVNHHDSLTDGPRGEAETRPVCSHGDTG